MTLKKANRVLGKCFIGALLKPFLITGLVVMPAAGLLAQPPLGAPAMNACKGQQQGVRCSFESPHGKVYGSCHALPYKGQGICVPEDRNAAGRGDPSGLQQMKPGRFPGSREHRVLQSDGSPDLLKSSVKPPVKGYFDVSIEDDFRVLKANGIPSHETGRFPNTGNPNAIKPQAYRFRVPLNPRLSGRITPLAMRDFGIAVNGVPFDPAAAEWYKGIRNDQWQYEALSGAVSLGIDDNYAHVQPTGAYHYHGMPTALLRELSLLPARHSPLVGWAADGFPVYAKYGFVDALDENAGIRELTSSWRLRKGQRPYDKNTPGGYYDGTFTGDYVFQAGAGDLDECNGRFTVTPEFPLGTYAYFLTENWPVIPRCWKGEPSRDFDRKGLR